ncbi:MAG TPA: NlpC/P60 family protein [Actinomycetota bacterium]|nr:NlpC/P60 family protein [Actinomycetota bacterium]
MLLTAVVLPLAGLWMAPMPAGAQPASRQSLEQQLDRLNQEADQLVEDYLEQKAALDSIRKDIAGLRDRTSKAEKDYRGLQAAVSAQWTAAYVRGTGTDIASLLGAGDPTVALQRMQSLELLAQRNEDMAVSLQAARRSYDDSRSTLVGAEKRQAAEVARLAAKTAKVKDAVRRTEALLARMNSAQRARVVGSGSGGGSTPAAPLPNLPPASGGAAKAVAYAKAQIGKPYAYGAAGPGSFDCSGLTMMAWAQAGVSLPHSSRDQYSVTRRVSRSELRPGDLVFYYTPISHVSIYVGSGMRVTATHTGSTVKLQSLGTSIVGYGRPM